MKQYKMIIEVDTNDGDMVEETSDVDADFVDKVRTMLNRIDKDKSFSKEDYEITPETQAANPSFTKEDWEWYEDFLPNGEYGYASLESVKILPFTYEEVLF